MHTLPHVVTSVDETGTHDNHQSVRLGNELVYVPKDFAVAAGDILDITRKQFYLAGPEVVINIRHSVSGVAVKPLTSGLT